MSKDAVVRLQALDGTWETCGVDRLRGVHPILSPPTANGWGSDTVGFELRRDPRAIWPDLTTWTPVEIEIGGSVVWDGRVKDTPSKDGADQVMSVQCEGWQYHLDDDLYRPFYVHNDLTAWKDARSVLAQDLTIYTTAGNVQAGQGGIVLGWPNGAILPANCRVGVTLDLGPGNTAESAVVEFQGVTGPANSGSSLYVRSTPMPDESHDAGVHSDAISFTLAALGTNPSTNYGAFATPYRYLTIFLYVPGAVTLNADVSVQIKGIRVFAEDTYRTSFWSALRAPTVINDALDQGTILLSADRSQIDPNNTVSFDINACAPGARKTAREMCETVNGYHNYTLKLKIGRVPVFLPLPSAPKLEVGSWTPMETEDQSANSGEDIYNAVYVTATDPAGNPIEVVRFRGQDGSGRFSGRGVPTFPNPTFDTNTTGWTGLVGGAITRTTTAGEFDSSPAGGKLTVVSGIQPGYVTTTLSGVAKRGRVYRITARIRTATTNTFAPPTLAINATGPAAAAEAALILPISTAGAFITATLLWRPKADVTNPVVWIGTISNGVTSSIVYIDSMQSAASVDTLADRRGFIRAKELQIGATMPSDGIAMAQIGDAWLAAHRTNPFKGTVEITGDQAIRTILTGATVGPEQLLTRTGELLRFSDRSDPADGSHGRDGVIVEAKYDHAKNAAVVTLDSPRGNFEALLARLAIVTGAR